jgi:acetyltransferase-like isoleucine patch superfamily enzyme
MNVPDKPRIHPLVWLTWQIERSRGRVNIPFPQWLRSAMFYGRPLLHNLWDASTQALIHEPALRYRCRHIGHRLRLYGPPPQILGNGIIEIGDDVEIAPGSVFVVGLGLPEPPLLRLGDHVHLGPHNIISAIRGVTIGAHTRTGPAVCLYDNDMHPLDPVLRRQEFGMTGATQSAPITIEDDVWIGVHALVLKGVTLGRGAVVGAGAVVTESVPPACVVAGNPARIIARLPSISQQLAVAAETRNDAA